MFERRRRAGGDRSRFGVADRDGDLVEVQCQQRQSRRIDNRHHGSEIVTFFASRRDLRLTWRILTDEVEDQIANSLNKASSASENLE